MRGHTIRRTWKHDPTLYAPPRYRRACSYAPFISGIRSPLTPSTCQGR